MNQIRVALIQFDATPEAVETNLDKMAALAREAARRKARWIMFHEGTISDYTPQLAAFAEHLPDGRSTESMMDLAAELDCYINFGLSETDGERYFMSQVFVGPAGFIYCYRKSWLWLEPDDRGYRNEWARYDPGTGPDLFEFDGVRATCFICADGESPRCLERVRLMKPDVVFYPNNRRALPEFDVLGQDVRAISAPMLVTNRIGMSWVNYTTGGCVVYSADGEVLAKANREGREEILIHDLELQAI
ncbi:MAG: carbon-nitrogen hydrolase family protein [Fuerstiella sp.]|nr:carbon-nitrogen hydrolase family protein [Fuerstiella sp.]